MQYSIFSNSQGAEIFFFRNGPLKWRIKYFVSWRSFGNIDKKIWKYSPPCVSIFDWRRALLCILLSPHLIHIWIEKKTYELRYKEIAGANHSAYREQTLLYINTYLLKKMFVHVTLVYENNVLTTQKNIFTKTYSSSNIDFFFGKSIFLRFCSKLSQNINV